MSTEDFTKGSVSGCSESTHAVALDFRSRRQELDDDKGRRFMVARLLNLTAADQHAEQLISRELD
jgi:hypothetical protein